MFLNGPNMSAFVWSEFLNTMVNNTRGTDGTRLFNLITQEVADNLSEFKARQEHFLSAGITGSGMPCPLSISVDSGCENSGPHFFLVSTLPTEPSSQPYVKIGDP